MIRLCLPRARGFTANCLLVRRRHVVSSPRAGVHRKSARSRSARSSVFPACGGSPRECTETLCKVGCLPRVRGFTGKSIGRASAGRVSSPRAGVHRLSGIRSRVRKSVFPASGGSPHQVAAIIEKTLYLPRVRGFTERRRADQYPAHVSSPPAGVHLLIMKVRSATTAVFPPRAGVHRCAGATSRSTKGVFPACGGSPPWIVVVYSPFTCSSPRAGVHRCAGPTWRPMRGVFPARGGSPYFNTILDDVMERLPRVRGFTGPLHRHG